MKKGEHVAGKMLQTVVVNLENSANFRQKRRKEKKKEKGRQEKEKKPI